IPSCCSAGFVFFLRREHLRMGRGYDMSLSEVTVRLGKPLFEPRALLRDSKTIAVGSPQLACDRWESIAVLRASTSTEGHSALLFSLFPRSASSVSFLVKQELDRKMNDLMTKSFYSYADLKKEALKDLESGAADDVAIEMAAGDADGHLRHFFEEAGLAKEEMAAIRDLLARLQAANEESKSLHQPEALRGLRDRINADIVRVLKTARGIRGRLEAMDRSNAVNRRLSGCREGTPVDRTRTAVTNGLRIKLKELMMEFQALRQRMMAEYRETVERRYFTVTGEAPEEEVIERIIANGESEGMVKKAMLEHGRGKVLATVHEIQDRHDAAKEVERSLLELHQVFLDMAVMVEAQGEQMDDIEHHVASAAHYVKDGTKELKCAKEYQRSSRKWLCIGIILLLLIILVIVIPIATSFSKS
ncbi:unnamed protein product, partial [Musa acuminata subsp. burmannicoides]